jgi:hypothetical protein
VTSGLQLTDEERGHLRIIAYSAPAGSEAAEKLDFLRVSADAEPQLTCASGRRAANNTSIRARMDEVLAARRSRSRSTCGSAPQSSQALQQVLLPARSWSRTWPGG